MQQDSTYEQYYVPAQSPWPIVGAVALFFLATGFANYLHSNVYGKYLMLIGFTILLVMIYGWFRNVIQESLQGLYSKQMDRSFRWGMIWFIFSEVFFFLAFFGALFYIREFTVPWLGGSGAKLMTGSLLWPEFVAKWPLLVNPSHDVVGPTAVINPWGLPLINTALLLTSSVTLTIAHHALKDNKRNLVIIMTLATVLLGWIFLGFQATEYMEAYHELGLTLSSGIYGSTFFILTGFHGAHVAIGSLILFIMLIRCIKGHFSPEKHFAFEAGAWYWHFVDVVWIALFLFVYCL